MDIGLLVVCNASIARRKLAQ